jgi:hypothetical protein
MEVLFHQTYFCLVEFKCYIFLALTKLLPNRFSSEGSISQVILHDPVLDMANSS